MDEIYRLNGKGIQSAGSGIHMRVGDGKVNMVIVRFEGLDGR